MKQLITIIFLLSVSIFGTSYTSAGNGNWNSSGTWSPSGIPGSGDDVTISSGHTVTLDAAGLSCNNLSISGTLQFNTTTSVDLTANGNITVNTGGIFRVTANTLGLSSPNGGLAHTLYLKGNLTNSGTLDFRTGTSGTTLSVCNITLSGTGNSTLNVPYVSSSNGEFNYITINKTSPARVLLSSDIITAGGSGTGPANCNSGIAFTNGIVETGAYKLAYQGTTAAQISGGSSTSYVIGNLGRGMSTSAGSSKDFYVGDESGYKPFYIRSTTSGTATGHLVIVKCVYDNANTGSSTLGGGIDKVSAIRYFQVTYSNTLGGAANMSFDLFKIGYGTDDGIVAGNTDLRVAYSTDARVNWTGISQTTAHTTAITDPPTQITPDAITAVTVNSGSSMYLTLGRVTGTTTNSLTENVSVGDYGSVGTGDWGTDGSNWIVCQTTGTWTGATQAVSAPSSSTDVRIRAGHIITVNSNSTCRNVSFNSFAGKLTFSSSSVLNVYGDVAIAAVGHNPFSSWATGGKFKFRGGAATQTISNLGTTSTSPYPLIFNELVVDKSSGKFTTSASGGNYKLCIGTSLEVVSGTFELASTDDIEGRDIGWSAQSPTITVSSAGTFNMAGSTSHIRRATNTGEETSKIGKMTVYGAAYLACGSSNRINFNNIDIESGGTLYIPSDRDWTANYFNPGTVTVKSNGAFRNSISTNYWYNNTTTATTLQIDDGGTFHTFAGTTSFPNTLVNNGTVRYGSSTAVQTIVDMNYSRLELSYSDYAKNWALGANRVISDSLETNNSAALTITSDAARSLTINGTLRLTSGSIDITDSDVSFTLADGANISRATGTISGTPVFSGQVNVRYTSVNEVTTGTEIPAATNALNDLSITGSGGVLLGANTTVNGALILTSGLLSLGSNNLSLGAASTVSGTPSAANMIVATGSGELRKVFSGNGSFTFPVGDNTGTAEYSPVAFTLNSNGGLSSAYVAVKLSNAKHTNIGTYSNYLNRYWSLSSSGITSPNYSANFTYTDADIVGTENTLYGGKNSGGMNVWTGLGPVDADNNRITAPELTSFSDFSAMEIGALPVELTSFASAVNGREVTLSWNTATEVNSSLFAVERSEDGSAFTRVGNVQASGYSNAPRDYTFTDKSRLATGKYFYRLKMVDTDGTFEYSKVIEAEVSVPAEFALSQNYPNPFNPSTKIDYQVPVSAQVTIALFSVAGEKIADLVDAYQEGGYYSTQIDAGKLNIASGMYLFRMTAAANGNALFAKTLKLLITK